MNANITLKILPCTEFLPDGKPAPFSTITLKNAQSKLLCLDAGKFLLQNIHHPLVDIDLFEYDIDSNAQIEVKVNEPTIVMLAMLEGHSILYSEDGNILKENYGNCCYMSYIPGGNYSRTFLTGKHQMLLLTIPAALLLQEIKRFPEFLPILDGYYAEVKTYLSLETAAIAKRIFKLVKKLNSRTSWQGMEPGQRVQSFLLDCLEAYNKSLELSGIYDAIQQQKADELVDFLRQNYASDIVNNKAELAALFYISEKTMLRLIKKRLGKSLHQFIIELRMLYSLKQLMMTDRSVKEVAESVGYHDPYHFSKAFKDYFNISPSKIENLSVPDRLP
uniref:helix-turn-helix domain-containing protein n=1 Tax=Pedobacter schmidteae TaxID=2201271 RepID=UPI000EB0FD2F|nr:helix-turn-helix transcriptional regulator [Pedobacter schmidteae]